ncbi:related to potential regulatory subunit for Glc7p [Cephalotrichum gorgonifer]|uniref:Related to potential regulatory subunit for Glc7p n=1 Tax=Cephalotrichum gorgonifer TaxID=2041049 RepID=A0AAE8N475_9PEZI|nr:related to potential regulatory subunit for Glc7p [Cephalotrichum gorgonifer]
MAPTDDEKLAQLQAVTGASVKAAREYLQAFNGDVEAAAQALLAESDVEDDEAANEAGPSTAVPDSYTGPRTLDGRPAPEDPSRRPKKPAQKHQPRRGVATLSSLGSGGHAHGSDDGDDEDEDSRDRGDLFAGGEKSGLAVKDPSKGGERGEGSRGIINDILAKAREQARTAAEDADEQPPTRSWGGGHTLGGDGVESRRVVDPNAAAGLSHAQANAEPQDRTIHIWHDGFSFDDGPLYRFDDPANQETLRLIRSGRAPLHLMNVRLDQPVNAHISQHDEPWKQLPKIYRPFGSEGRRLGSPVPGAATSAPPPAPTSQPAAASGSGAPDTGADATLPTISLRVQLPDGTRLPARFNTTQTVGDIYDFVTRAHPATRTRPFVVATTFPTKDHSERGLVLGQMPEFKKGGVAVVKWT